MLFPFFSSLHIIPKFQHPPLLQYNLIIVPNLKELRKHPRSELFMDFKESFCHPEPQVHLPYSPGTLARTR